jgi:large-conductance mechanosensitive channel
MIVTILDWVGTVLVIIGTLLITLKTAFKPEVRLCSLGLYFTGNIVWMPFALLIGQYGLFITQIVLFVINLNGIFICIKAIKEQKKVKD